MEEWRRRQKHHEDYVALQKKLGFLSKDGKRVVRFDGPKWFPAWNALGHDRASFEECRCKKLDADISGATCY